MAKPRYINRLDQVPQLSTREQEILKPVARKFAFRTNEYYQSLIDWDDPNDPIHRIVIPDTFELLPGGELDASHEDAYTVAPGCQHKYRHTALLLASDVCGAYCRFCFRKRLFMDGSDEVLRDVSQGLDYISSHPEISNVLLTGGDPLIMSTGKLENIIRQLRQIDHVKIIRIGTKIPAFNPFRILDDPALLEMLDRYSIKHYRIYMVVQFNHPRELTPEAVEAMDMVHRTGVVTVNQTPLLRGINDDPIVLTELFNRLSYIGVPPYYVFQCRPTAGNSTFSTPVELSMDIFDCARHNCSGLAKRARLTMSHATGKIEILARDDEFVYFKYHRAHDPRLKGRFFRCRCNPNAYWLDDYEEAAGLLPADDRETISLNLGRDCT